MGKKIKLKYYPKDMAHPFMCPECKAEDYFIDEKTGTIKLQYSKNDWIRRNGEWKGKKRSV